MSSAKLLSRLPKFMCDSVQTEDVCTLTIRDSEPATASVRHG